MSSFKQRSVAVVSCLGILASSIYLPSSAVAQEEIVTNERFSCIWNAERIYERERKNLIRADKEVRNELKAALVDSGLEATAAGGLSTIKT